MAADVFVSVILLFLFTPVKSVRNENVADINNVLYSLDKIMYFYKEDYRNLNLDGYFGLRILQGQLEMIVSDYKQLHERNISTNILDHIQQLVDSASNVSSLGLKYIESDDPVYFRDFKTIILSPWRIKKPHQKLQPNLRWESPQYKTKSKVQLTEEFSDRCISQLLHVDCNITDDCADIMTTRGLTGYHITHQLLWSVIGESLPNCNKKLSKIVENHGLGNISMMQLEWCTNNFYEMIAIVQVLMHGKVHEIQQDLFLEQQFVCPNLGYHEFLKKDYLNQMISWQFPMGCYGDKEDNKKVDLTSLLSTQHKADGVFMSNTYIDPSTLVKNFLIKNETILTQERINKQESHSLNFINELKPTKRDDVNKSADVYSEKSTKLLITESNNHSALLNKIKRHLLSEKQMADGCLSHKTAVATGALCMYLRYLMEPGNVQWTGQHELFLPDARSLLQADNDGQSKAADEGGDEDEGVENMVDKGDQYPAEEEGDEEEGEEEEYNQGEENYKTVNGIVDKANNPLIQFDPRDNDNIVVNDDNGKELVEYSNNQENPNAKHQVKPANQDDHRVEDTREQQEDRNYYDDEGETEKSIIKRNKQITPRPHPPIRTRRKHSEVQMSAQDGGNLPTDQPNYTVIILVSVSPFFVLVYFLLKFIRRRRLHIRYHY